jgi:simple sugar transport system permease protein
MGCLLFGFSDALSTRLQSSGVSSYLVLSVPYLVALAALFGLSYRTRPRLIPETLASMGRALSPQRKPAADDLAASKG